MSKKLIFFFGILLVGLALLLFIRENIGDIRPAILPSNPQRQTSQSNPQGVGDMAPFALTTADGLQVGVFADDLGNARDLEITDGGTILVSSPDRNTVTALKDEDGDGKAEIRKIAATGENVVHGLAFHKGFLYLAQKNSLNRYTWNEERSEATFDAKLLDLPGTSNHIYRTLTFDNSGNMYISIGSNCNVCIEPDPFVGTVITAKEDGSGVRVFAKGQRNAPFLARHPITGAIWATGMGRDNLGDDLPPDEVNILQNNGDYGWPICFGKNILDTQFDKKTYIQNPCNNTIPRAVISDYQISFPLLLKPR